MTSSRFSAEARSALAWAVVRALTDENIRQVKEYGNAGPIADAILSLHPSTEAADTTAALEKRVAECAAGPDHDDILETIENADSAWRTKGYTSALAEVRDMANVGRALMEALPDGYSYMNCPSEIVSDLQNERDEARAALNTDPSHAE